MPDDDADAGRRPRVLCVVPTLGTRPDYLRETLDSLEAQRPPVAVVLVAPESATDVRREALSRSVPLVADPGTGLSAAVNAGWRAFGTGHDYWTWLGDDDTWARDTAARAVAVLDGDLEASMVFGRCAYVGEDGQLLFEARPTRLAALLLRWGPNLVPQPGSLYRADAVRKVGLLDESLRYAMDLDLFLRLQDVGRLQYLPEVVGTFRWHSGSTTVASTADSEAEADRVRRRTWTGRRALGPLVAPLAVGVGRVLHRVHRVR